MDWVTEDIACSIHEANRFGYEALIERIIPETVDANTIDTVMNSADKKLSRGDLKNWLESDTGHGNPGLCSPARSDRRGSSNSAHWHVAVDWALESLPAPGDLLAREPTP